MTAIARRTMGRPIDRTLPQRRRDEILLAATRFFARNGYHDADIEVLAAELGIGKGTIYRYFRNKEELFKKTLLRGLSALHETVVSASNGVVASVSPGEDELDTLHRAIVAYLGYFDLNPDVIELMVIERVELKGRGTPTYFSHRERYLRPWQKRLRHLMQEGHVRTMEVETITSCLGMLMYGALVTHPFMSGRRSLKIQARGLIDVVFNGIRSRSSGSSGDSP